MGNTIDEPKRKGVKPLLATSISTGWAVRNFFQTGIVAELQKMFRVLVITTPHIRRHLVDQGYAAGLIIEERSDNAEPRSWRYLRQIRKKLYMDFRESATDAIWAKYVRRPLYQRIGARALGQVVRWFDARRLLALAERLDFSLNNNATTEAILARYQPSLFFATHASSYFEESLLHAAVKQRVPALFMVLSWDHLSSKVVLSSAYRYVLVWNGITRDEILATSGDYRPEQIKVVGVPQYDCYMQAPTQSYAEWCRKYRLDPARRTIVFSTMPQVRHGFQHVIVERLLEVLKEGRELPSDLQLLIKAHPFDNTDKYDALLGRGYPVGYCRSSLPRGVHQKDWVPSKDEMYVARDALYFCTLNINIFSTVTLEAAFFDKPVVHVAYDPYPVSNRIPCREYYNFDHFRNIVTSGASTLVENDDELVAAIRAELEHPEAKAVQRRRLVESYFHNMEGTASRAVVECVRGAFVELADR